MNATGLQKILKLHKYVVPTKTPAPILRHVLILPDKIISTDLAWRLETPCIIPGVPKAGILIEHAEFLRAANFVEGEVHFGAPKEPSNSDHLGLYGDGAVVNVYRQNVQNSNFPNAPKAKGDLLPANGLIEAFSAVADFADPTHDWEVMHHVEIKDGDAVGMNGSIFKTVKTNAPNVVIPADKPSLIKAFDPAEINPQGLLVSPLGKLYFKPLDREFPKWQINAEKGEYLGKLVLDKKLLGRIEKLRLLLNDRFARVKLVLNGTFKFETETVNLDLGGEAAVDFSVWQTFSLLQKILDDIKASEVKFYRSEKEVVTLLETEDALYGIARRNDED